MKQTTLIKHLTAIRDAVANLAADPGAASVRDGLEEANRQIELSLRMTANTERLNVSTLQLAVWELTPLLNALSSAIAEGRDAIAAVNPDDGALDAAGSSGEDT